MRKGGKFKDEHIVEHGWSMGLERKCENQCRQRKVRTGGEGGRKCRLRGNVVPCECLLSLAVLWKTVWGVHEA